MSPLSPPYSVKIPEGVVLKHSREPSKESRRDTYFDIKKLKAPSRLRYQAKETPGAATEAVDGRGEAEEKEVREKEGDAERKEEGKVSWLLNTLSGVLLGLLDDVNEWLEQSSALFREVVIAVQLERRSVSPATEDTPLSPAGSGGSYGASERTSAAAVPGDGEIVPAEEEEGGGGGGGVGGGGRGGGGGGTVPFDQRGGLLERHLAPSSKAQQDLKEYEADLKERASKYSKRFQRLAIALYYTFLSNNQYVPFFFILLNIIVNGSLLSLIYAVLLFGWGLLSIPWPSKRFWLSLIFYTMFVLVVKYSFQFKEIQYWMDNFDINSGLYPPRLIGIEKTQNFVANAVLDILLLTFLLIHRGLLFVSTNINYFACHI